ncbi:MAG TPA: MFS transporter [Steroidobacteraceae bacterium]|nr:MFS transporter [Steroidobacteraceae bacterium]
MSNDPRDILARSPMSWLQIVAVAITIGLNGLDGFDVQAISFASPGITAEWHIDKAALGIVLSMELIGMALGSLLLGSVADRIGRRPTMLGCLVVMVMGMYLATTASGTTDLSIWRVLTGFGIGGLLAAINAIAMEYSNARRRNLSVALMSIGYPLGAVLGGLVVQHLLAGSNWRSVFYFGTAITALFIPLVWLCVPESIHWLTRKQPAGALERINRTFARMGHAAAASLPVISAEVRKRSYSDLFRPGLIATTICVALAYFFHIVSFYFIIKWIPQLVVDMGFKPSAAAGVLVMTNVGGATGGAVLGLLTLRFGVKPLTIAVMLLSTLTVALFGRSPPNLDHLKVICFCAGFCTNAGIVGMYAIFAQAFPTHVRASGTGFAIGIGRGGSVLAPTVAGFLFKAGYALPGVALIMGLSATVAAVIMMSVKLKLNQSEAESEAAAATASGASA